MTWDAYSRSSSKRWTNQGARARRHRGITTLRADPDSSDAAILEVHEFKPGDAEKLPFNQPSGSQSAALGPLIKRTPPAKGKEAGSERENSGDDSGRFEEIADEKQPWSGYFREAHECFQAKNEAWDSEVTHEAEGSLRRDQRRLEEKRTVLLAFQDAAGRLPGSINVYVDYLQNVLARTKYATGPELDRLRTVLCALCGQASMTVFPNAPARRGHQSGESGPRWSLSWHRPGGRVEGLFPMLWLAPTSSTFTGTTSRAISRSRSPGERALIVPETSVDAPPRPARILSSDHASWRGGSTIAKCDFVRRNFSICSATKVGHDADNPLGRVRPADRRRPRRGDEHTPQSAE